MPVIRVSNTSPNAISLGSPLGSIGVRDTKIVDVTVAELEHLSATLAALQNNELIVWSILASDTDNRTEFFPVGASTTKTQGRLDIYVDATTGHDSNYGTKEQPLASLIEAERRIPDFVNHPVVIHVAPHTGNGYAPPTFRERIMRASIDVYAPDVNVLVEETACLAGSNHVTINTPPGLGVDALRGKTVEITSGLLRGYRRTIQTNDDSSITFGWPLPSTTGRTLAVGDTFRVVEPTTRLYVAPREESGHHNQWLISKGPTSSNHYFSEASLSDYDRHALAFANFVVDGPWYLRAGPEVRFHGCEFSSPEGFMSLTGGRFVAAVDGYASPQALDGTPIDGIPADAELATIGARVAGVDSRAWAGWGIFSDGLVFIEKASAYLGVLVCESLQITGSQVVVQGGNVWGGGVAVTSLIRDTSYVLLDGKILLPDIQMLIQHNSGGPALKAQGPGTVVVTEEARFLSSTGSGIRATDGANVLVRYTTSVVATTGLVANTGGRIQFSDGDLGVTATGNEIEVGNTPQVGTLAVNLANVGDYLAEPDGSVVQRVA